MTGQEAISAPTPPLEALRTCLSCATTQFPNERKKVWDPTANDRVRVSLIDMSREYFNAHTGPDRPTYDDLPPELGAPEGTRGRLNRHMYGARHAAEGWHEEYSCTLRELGFTQGTPCPCLFYHRKRGLATSVHGDDSITAGPKHQLDWFELGMEEVYELSKGGRLGPGADDQKEGTVLYRVIRWTDVGPEYEADPRRVERLLIEVELDGANGAVTPAQKILAHQVEQEEELPTHLVTPFRAWAARADYLAAYRLDTMFSAKEVCRYMSKPTTLAMAALKRLCRYLRARPRLVFKYPLQRADHIDTYSDNDNAGCIRIRKSTSGGILIVGSHAIKCCAAIAASLALSSGEAELYGVVRAAGIALGHRSSFRDLGVTIPTTVWTYLSTAIWDFRHIQCHTLWVQQRLRQG